MSLKCTQKKSNDHANADIQNHKPNCQIGQVLKLANVQ